MAVSLYSKDDFLHPPTDEPDWQESVVLVFSDETSGVVGFVRAGSEPNLGLSQAHFDLATRDGLRFRHNPFDLPMRPEDRTKDGFAAGPVRWRIPRGEHVHVVAETPEASVDLRLHDFFESTPWRFVGMGDLSNVAHGHLESSGRVEGSVRIGEKTFRIENGLGHRDHSWGKRDVRTMRSFRWVAGTCGPELSFSGIVLHTTTGHFMRAGWVRRCAELRNAEGFDVIATVNADGVTTRGGSAEWTLEGGERVRIDAEVVDGFVTSYRSDHGGAGSHVGVEGISLVRSASLRGFCDFNVATNPTGGEAPAASVCEEWATLTPSLSRRPPRP